MVRRLFCGKTDKQEEVLICEGVIKNRNDVVLNLDGVVLICVGIEHKCFLYWP